jgi:hypothetical protein
MKLTDRINLLLFQRKSKSLSNLIFKYIDYTEKSLYKLIKENLYICNKITNYPLDLTIEELVLKAVKFGYGGFWIKNTEHSDF